ncbi:MAG TPA: hypothetical protein P5227_04160, partial [Emcibacteraceae bacterium]|nr:hypothetical protein [Emcibacteraceae bacterium]
RTKEGMPNVVTSKLRYHREIYKILSELCEKVIGTNDGQDLFSKAGEFDYVFSLFNRMGFRSSELYASAICEYLKIPYLGASPEVRGVAENKSLFKHIARSCGIDVANSATFYPGDKINKPDQLSAPYFVKPLSGGNSEWIRSSSYCEDWSAAHEEIEFLLSKNVPVLMEDFLEGINLTVPVLGGTKPQVLGVVEVPTIEPHNVLTSEEKLQDHGDMSFQIFDNDNVRKTITQHAELLNNSLRPIDYFRMDYRYNDGTEQLTILEINVCCDISSFGSFAFAAQEKGLTQKDLVQKILEISLSRQQYSGGNE